MASRTLQPAPPATFIKSILAEHSFSEEASECSCDEKLTIWSYGRHVADVLGESDDHETAEAIFCAIDDHESFHTSVAGHPICLCGEEITDDDMLRHISTRVEYAIKMAYYDL